MDMSASYKPVMLLAILDSVDTHGTANLAAVVTRFRQFYEKRKSDGLVVERATARMSKVEGLDDSTVQRLMLAMPFEKFERRKYLQYARDLAFIRFEPHLWRQLTLPDLSKLREICNDSIHKYFQRLAQS